VSLGQDWSEFEPARAVPFRHVVGQTHLFFGRGASHESRFGENRNDRQRIGLNGTASVHRMSARVRSHGQRGSLATASFGRQSQLLVSWVVGKEPVLAMHHTNP